VQLTRQTNIVKDAADGMIFTLKQGGQTGTTTLTVAQDKTVATAGMQDVIIKLNALLSGYKAASTATKNTDGSIKEAPLSGDSNIRSMISRIKAAFLGPSAGLASTSTYQVTSQLGIKTNVDGTLSLDSTAFQNAIANDPAAAKRLFTFSGESTNGVVAFTGAGSTTATGSVQFVIKADPGTGALSGTFTGTANGPITVPVTNGVLLGTGDLDGLTLTVTGAGSGTLNLIRGAGQATSDLLSSATSAGSGSIQSALANIQTQNRSLTTQIDLGQAILDRRKLVLQKQFSQMETIVAQMRAAAGSLTGA
jgi:flagellar hook-associated protein 2